MGCDAPFLLYSFQHSSFQSTHPHGVRLAFELDELLFLKFQSTHPHGVRLCKFSSVLPYKCFNPRTHMGCDPPDWLRRRHRRVSIHAPTWGATFFIFLVPPTGSFQSTHPHGVRPVCARPVSRATSMFQSTHPHGVRPPGVGADAASLLFQSTHPHGVRQAIRLLSSSTACFNPRTHMGCDLVVFGGVVFVQQVSIHAPTWGATCPWWCRLRGRGCFNPRTHMGCDIAAVLLGCQHHVSIHAPTWGATEKPSTKCGFVEVSIHAPTWGATLNADQMDDKIKVSIHAPTWGATNDRPLDPAGTDVSIHAPTWGATSSVSFVLQGKSVSIHAPTWGATAAGRAIPESHAGFNPRTHMGCDFLFPAALLYRDCFNPRTHMGCDNMCPFDWRIKI